MKNISEMPAQMLGFLSPTQKRGACAAVFYSHHGLHLDTYSLKRILVQPQEVEKKKKKRKHKNRGRIETQNKMKKLRKWRFF